MVKKVLLGIVGVIAVAVVVVLALAARQPDTFKVERNQIIAASQSAIYPDIADFHRWSQWSPWEHLDPSMKKTYSGEPGAVGSTYAWVGNDQAGEGKMTVIESTPEEQLKIKLDFIKPFESTSTTTFALRPVPGSAGTQVVWTMDGPMQFASKVMCVFMDMDAMIGKDFEAGLTNLKRVVESSSSAPTAPSAAAN